MSTAVAIIEDEHDHDGRIARIGICSVCTAATIVTAEAVELVEPSVAHQPDLFGELDGDLGRVFELMKDGRSWTLRQLSGALDIPEASVSARIRDLRKREFGEHIIEKRALGGRRGYAYRLVR
jgi:hypothetical protein